MSDVLNALRAGTGPDGRFGHRDHLRLAFTALAEYGTEAGEETVCTLIRIAATANGFGDRYHETVTRFWCRQIVAHLGASAESFDAFYERNRHLHDKLLVKRHYSQELLDTREAFEGWVEPDLMPIDAGRAGSGVE